MRRKILQRNRADVVGYDGYYHGLYSLFAKVETQDFASLQGVYAVIASGLWMGVLALAGRETQDFASLQGGYAAIVSGLLNGCIGMGCSGDARFCVSTGRTPLV